MGFPNANVLLSPLSTREAVLSTKIEGTQATFGEVLEFEAIGEVSVGGEKAEDIHEVLNYRSALRHALKLMEALPLSQRVVKEAHAVLMEGVRGQDKAPGRYRSVANWIGPHGCSIQTARYVPPSPERVADAMSLWEKYLHTKHADTLTQLALLHAEF